MTPSSSAKSAQATCNLTGTVVAVQANYYSVRLDAEDVGLPNVLLCTRRARLKKMGQQVMVGDRVQIEEPDWEGQRGAISAVFPRRTHLDRPPIANANQILLVFALAEPELDPHQLTRFLVKAELTELDVRLCLNKQDLVSSETQQSWRDRLSDWGYDPLMISVETDLGIFAIEDALKDRITVVSGPSGVGKSSLINRLIPAAKLRVGTVSGKLGRGRHTTRHVELFELPRGGLLADTPGFNQPDIACSPYDLQDGFPEIRRALKELQCQFSDCLHREEPGCAVPKKWDRYADYLQLLEDCLTQAQAEQESATPETAYKLKVTHDGTVQEEPLLQPKKYRRTSRRSRKQAMEELRYELTDQLNNLDSLEEDELDDL